MRDLRRESTRKHKTGFVKTIETSGIKSGSSLKSTQIGRAEMVAAVDIRVVLFIPPQAASNSTWIFLRLLAMSIGSLSNVYQQHQGAYGKHRYDSELARRPSKSPEYEQSKSTSNISPRSGHNLSQHSVIVHFDLKRLFSAHRI